LKDSRRPSKLRGRVPYGKRKDAIMIGSDDAQGNMGYIDASLGSGVGRQDDPVDRETPREEKKPGRTKRRKKHFAIDPQGNMIPFP